MASLAPDVNSVKRPHCATVAALAAAFVLAANAAQAMTLRMVNESTMLLSGEIFYADLEAVTKAFAQYPKLSHVILRNSMGGNSWTGYRIGELFREKGVTTVVSGHCVSSCSRLFLGGKERRFSSDYPASLTYVGFHGHYDFDALNHKNIERFGLAEWLQKYTDGKLDPKLAERWINLPRRAGDARFYPAEAQSVLQARSATFICQGTESNRPQQCETLSADPLTQGIITSRTLYRSPDAASLFYQRRLSAHAPTRFATLNDTQKLPVRNASDRRDYTLFLQAKLPRAFALSPDGRFSAWSGNNNQSIESALERCAKKSKTVCRLYALDEVVVW